MSRVHKVSMKSRKGVGGNPLCPVPGLGSGWADLGRAGPAMGCSMALPRVQPGPPVWAWSDASTARPHWLVHHGPGHAGPWLERGSRWTWSTHHLLHCDLHEPGARACVAGEKRSPQYLRSVLTDGERLVSLASGAGAQLMWVKAPPSLSVLVGGVNVACGVP